MGEKRAFPLLLVCCNPKQTMSQNKTWETASGLWPWRDFIIQFKQSRTKYKEGFGPDAAGGRHRSQWLQQHNSSTSFSSPETISNHWVYSFSCLDNWASHRNSHRLCSYVKVKPQNITAKAVRLNGFSAALVSHCGSLEMSLHLTQILMKTLWPLSSPSTKLLLYLQTHSQSRSRDFFKRLKELIAVF